MQNFGQIKTYFNNLLIEGIVTKNTEKKNLFKEYVKNIKKNKILKTQFLVYNNLENYVNEDYVMANVFVNENIDLIKKYKQTDIKKANEGLIKLINKDKNFDKNYELYDLHETITKLIFTKKTAKNITNLTETTKKLVDYIQKNKTKIVSESDYLPNSMISNILVKKYNEKYENLTEDDKNVIKVLIEPNFEVKRKFYFETVKECIELVDGLLKESDEASKEKLLKVKNKLSENNDELSDKNFIEKISKLVELKHNLKNN